MLILQIAISTAVSGGSVGKQARRYLSLFLTLFKAYYFALQLRPLPRPPKIFAILPSLEVPPSFAVSIFIGPGRPVLGRDFGRRPVFFRAPEAP